MLCFLKAKIGKKHGSKKLIKEKFEPFCAVKFSFDPNGQRTIRISFKESEGAYSAIGTDALVMDINKATMNLGWLDAPGTKTEQGKFTWKGVEYKVPPGQPRNKNEVGATVQHEFGHAVALLHEHQNPRGAGIQWNVDKVYQQFSRPTKFMESGHYLPQHPQKVCRGPDAGIKLRPQIHYVVFL